MNKSQLLLTMSLFMVGMANQVQAAQISDQDFFDLFYKNGAAQLIPLIQQNPQLANKKNPVNGESTLFSVLRNYSAMPEEIRLIETLIALQPALVTEENSKGTNIFGIIATFDDQSMLRSVVQKAFAQALAKVQIHQAIKKEFIQALADKNYDKALHFFKMHPELINLKGPMGQNILFYLNQSHDAGVTPIVDWVNLVAPTMKEQAGLAIFSLKR